jgi:hypothetical protein
MTAFIDSGHITSGTASRRSIPAFTIHGGSDNPLIRALVADPITVVAKSDAAESRHVSPVLFG